jgi:hypothetical protein
MRLVSLSAVLLSLAACAAPIEPMDASADRSSPGVDAARDALERDAADALVSLDAPADTSSPPGPEAGPVRDAAPEASMPRCQLDPRNCGLCGRVCGEGMLGGRPACAEVQPGRWDCVNNCAGFGVGCESPDRTGAICCPGTACGPGSVGCR